MKNIKKLENDNSSSFNFCENKKINFIINDRTVCPRYSYMYLKNISTSYNIPENIKMGLNMQV